MDSVKRQSLMADRVIVLDNQSRANEIGRVGSVYPEAQILAMQENLGYSGGANRIIRETEDADYLLILIPTVLDARSLEAMVMAMEGAPSWTKSRRLLLDLFLHIS
jgi:GT2 family glycosyltransferase